LKRELAQQASLAEESRALQKQLKERTTEASKLQSTVKEMTSSLTNARNEIKSLQSKLAASRNTSLVAEGTQAKGPGAAKGSSRGGAAGAADAALAVQIAQLKEDLYSDLTGLIIRDVKHQDGEQIYDCIQTGVNGSKSNRPSFVLTVLCPLAHHHQTALHFKLSISSPSDKGTTTSLESAEFQYSPLLDANRDRQLIDILPEYLTVDITFSRQNAAKFYSRVADTLMKKRVE
jgi:small-conductance mechanosensitive channel